MGLSCKFSLKPIHWYFWCGSYGYFWWVTNLISVEIWGSPICFAFKDPHCPPTHQDLAKSDLKAAKQGVAALSALSVACHFRQSLRKLWPGGDGTCENRGGYLNFWHPQIQFYQFFYAWMAIICAICHFWQTFQSGKTPIENCWVNSYFAGSISKIPPKHDRWCLSEGFLTWGTPSYHPKNMGHFLHGKPMGPILGNTQSLITGWWFGTWILFFSIQFGISFHPNWL